MTRALKLRSGMLLLLPTTIGETWKFRKLQNNRGLSNWRIHIMNGSKRTETDPRRPESSSALHRPGHCRDPEHCLHNQGGLATEGIFLYPLVMSVRAMERRRWGSWII